MAVVSCLLTWSLALFALLCFALLCFALLCLLYFACFTCILHPSQTNDVFLSSISVGATVNNFSYVCVNIPTELLLTCLS